MLAKNQIIEQWAEVTLSIWAEKMSQLGVSNSFAHANSFEFELMSSGADISQVVFEYPFFLRFTDMGVGNGVSMEERENSNRKQKPWYSSTLILETRKLANILSANYAHKGAVIVRDMFV
jgi:hypothetical protein